MKNPTDAREPTLAVAAVVWLNSGVGRRMGDQAFPMGKGLIALLKSKTQINPNSSTLQKKKPLHYTCTAARPCASGRAP